MGAITRWVDQSLRRRIAVVVSGLALLLGAGVLAVSSWEVFRLSRTLYAARLSQLAGQIAPMVSRSAVDAATRLERAVLDPRLLRFVNSGGKVDADTTLTVIRQALLADARTATAIVDAGGTPLLEIGSWFGPRVAPDTATGVGGYRKLDDQTAFYDVRIPIRDRGTLIGWLVRRSRSTQTAATRAAFEGLMGEGIQLIVGSPGTGVWHMLGEPIDPPPSDLIDRNQVAVVRWGATRYLGYAVPLPGTPWRLIVRVPESIVSTPAVGYFRRAAVIAIVVVLTGVLVGVWLGRTLSRPIQGITEVAEQIASVEDPKLVPEHYPGEVGRLARAFNAMTERVALSTRRLRDNEASHRAFVSYASDGIWRMEFVPPASTTLSPSIQIDSWYHLSPRVEANQALVRMAGREPDGDMASLPLAELFPPSDPGVQRILLDFIRNGYRASGVELVTPGPNDSRRIFVNDLVGVVDGGGLRRIWGTRRDVTLSRLVDERLAKTDRLEAIGRLAGGIAHDFNNLLTAIVGYAESLQEGLPPDHPYHHDAVEINRIALRAAELTKQLLAFSRGQVMRPSLIDLNAVVRSTEGLLKRVLSDRVRLDLALSDAIDAVEVDPGQLERVILNLVVNARDAMPEGGVIRIATSPARLDEQYTGTRPGVMPGEYVALAVRDNGTGISDEVRQHLFEPFYTTKPKGKGTGLGLSTVYGIVRQSGGDIAVTSGPGLGTEFTVYLPVKGKISLPPSDGPMTAGGSGVMTLTGEESILVVEDEAPVREVVRRALAASGYTVLVAGEANEALQIEAEGGTIDLVLTDMLLPGLNGRDLACEFRKRRPRVRVLVMSGFTGDQTTMRETLPEGAGYLAKPFSLGDLRRRVREVLDDGDQGVRR
jgi:signal transduction histidine kinase/CheY-like chemotaxis protein